MISILFFKLLTEFVNIMIHGLLLSILLLNSNLNVDGGYYRIYVTIERKP